MQTSNQVKKAIFKKILFLCFVSAALAVGVSVFITAHLWNITNARNNLSTLRTWIMLQRANILFFAFTYMGLHFVFPLRKMYQWIFRHRWVLGIALLLLLTVNCYHGDSIGYYNESIQPNESSASAKAILGEIRSIRSDEFVATTPSILASSYGETPYSKYNSIMRGDETLNIINGVYVGYAALGNAPQELIYAVLPVEYAYSFCWWFPLILGFLMVLELFYIISRKNELLSVAGAFLVIFSSFYLWWGFSPYIYAASGTVVCVYYFLHSQKNWIKILLGMGMAICFSVFVTNLYPAWQVPLGYLFLAIGIWILHDNWQQVRSLKRSDWAILGCVIAFMVSMIFSYLYMISDYMTVIVQTVYPGERSDFGSFHIEKLFYCAQAPFYAYKDIGNASEAGVYFGLFPVPTIMAAYYWIKSRKKDWLTGGLLLAQIPMLLYVTCGLPGVIAKVLLLSHSTSSRTEDIIGLIQVFFIVIVLSRYEDVKKLSWKLAIPIGAVVAGGNIYFTTHNHPDYLNTFWIAVMAGIILVMSAGLVVKLKQAAKRCLLFGFIGISVVTGIYVRPLMKGFDAIFSKPVASEIQKICEEDSEAKWLTSGGGIVLSAYSVACGASTVNSVNTYPNLKLWETLDEESQYEEVYNRYAHVNVTFTAQDTSFELIQADYMQLNLSYRDIQKTGANYLLCMGEPDIDTENSYVKFEKIYEEDSIIIYHMIY